MRVRWLLPDTLERRAFGAVFRRLYCPAQIVLFDRMPIHHRTDDLRIKWTKVVLPPVFLEEELPISEAASSTVFTRAQSGQRDSRRRAIRGCW